MIEEAQDDRIEFRFVAFQEVRIPARGQFLTEERAVQHANECDVGFRRPGPRGFEVDDAHATDAARTAFAEHVAHMEVVVQENGRTGSGACVDFVDLAKQTFGDRHCGRPGIRQRGKQPVLQVRGEVLRQVRRTAAVVQGARRVQFDLVHATQEFTPASQCLRPALFGDLRPEFRECGLRNAPVRFDGPATGIALDIEVGRRDDSRSPSEQGRRLPRRPHPLRYPVEPRSLHDQRGAGVEPELQALVAVAAAPIDFARPGIHERCRAEYLNERRIENSHCTHLPQAGVSNTTPIDRQRGGALDLAPRGDFLRLISVVMAFPARRPGDQGQ